MDPGILTELQKGRCHEGLLQRHESAVAATGMGEVAAAVPGVTSRHKSSWKSRIVFLCPEHCVNYLNRWALLLVPKIKLSNIKFPRVVYQVVI